jgi:chromosome partitioning protein
MNGAKIIAVANTKGGCGKSTIAGNLAWAFATTPKLEMPRVLLVDADPQASVTRWFDLGEELPFERIQLNTARGLQAELPRQRRKYDLIVVDCPPVQADVTVAAVSSADLGLVPIQPSPMEMFSYALLVPLLRQAQAVNPHLRLRFVVNQMSDGTVLAKQVKEDLGETEIPLCRTFVHDRQAYRRIVAVGKSVVAESGPAREEVLALARELGGVLA